MRGRRRWDCSNLKTRQRLGMSPSPPLQVSRFEIWRNANARPVPVCTVKALTNANARYKQLRAQRRLRRPSRAPPRTSAGRPNPTPGSSPGSTTSCPLSGASGGHGRPRPACTPPHMRGKGECTGCSSCWAPGLGSPPSPQCCDGDAIDTRLNKGLLRELSMSPMLPPQHPCCCELCK